MKKALVLLSIAAVLLMTGCPSGGTAPKLIDYQGKEFDKEPPEWYFMSVDEVESTGTYEDKYVYKFESEASDSKKGAELLLENFDVPRAIAREVSTRVKNKAATAVVGDNDFIETYMEDVVQVLAEAQIAGLKKDASFWVLKEYKDPELETLTQKYTVTVLYTVDKKVLDKLIMDTLNGQGINSKPKTEEEKTAINRVKQAFEEGL